MTLSILLCGKDGTLPMQLYSSRVHSWDYNHGMPSQSFHCPHYSSLFPLTLFFILYLLHVHAHVHATY